MDQDFADVAAFRATLARDFAKPLARSADATVLSASWIDTRLGPMVMLSDAGRLHLLEFVARPDLHRQLHRLQRALNGIFRFAETQPAVSAARQLDAYFAGRSLGFDCAIAEVGTPFQLRVWACLQRIPPGETRTYTDLAHAAGKPAAVRAAAAANAMNRCAIIIPCHRIIGMDGNLTGYAGGLERKQWLLEHEMKFNRA